ncbi:hypothetical protein CALCODRAFT_344720 [Calocera cornea HHB12733]|uniref:Uncharacterized protein n=1 Tax=Calocera cornea HHB12733 TaxID=1353952 RepID=A0A165EWB2_9BASI|nr:hypothetical protein CALCODRAFT_344720 [Calocera cornea HHB12733]
MSSCKTYLFLVFMYDDSPERRCKNLPNHTGRGLECLAICINLIQIFRVRALLQGNRLIIIPLWCLFFINTFLSIALAAFVVSTSSLTAASPFITLGCLTQVNHPQLMLGPYISSTVYSGVLFFVTLGKLYPYFNSGSKEAPALTVFVRDGTVFFAVIFVVELVSLIWDQIITPMRPALQDIANGLRIALYAIAVGPTADPPFTRCCYATVVRHDAGQHDTGQHE